MSEYSGAVFLVWSGTPCKRKKEEKPVVSDGALLNVKSANGRS